MMRSPIRAALRALSANTLRTALTVLGIVIGVGAVIALTAVGRGAQGRVQRDLQLLGTNLLFVRPGSDFEPSSKPSSLSLDDARAIAALPGVQAVAPEAVASAQLVANGKTHSTGLQGVTEAYAAVRNARVASGRWISKAEADGAESVLVLGPTVARKLFGTTDPVGKEVRVVSGQAGTVFRVIGVTEAKGGAGLGDQDDVAYAPLTAVRARVNAQRTPQGQPAVSTINVQVADERLMASVASQITTLLLARHQVREPDFRVQDQREFMRALDRIGGSFTALLGAIAAISLLVGGIGIMNIMLVSVTERTREIGIRKAVGARRRDILAQFLVEAVVVSLLGGLLGVVLGAGGATAVGELGLSSILPVPGAEDGIRPRVGPDAALLAFGVSVAIGLFFGIYPAVRAARLHPIEALRHE